METDVNDGSRDVGSGGGALLAINIDNYTYVPRP